MINDVRKAKSGNKNERFASLLKLGEIVFHASDVANLWGIRDKNTLWKTVSRYSSSGILFRIQKGLYSVKNPKELDPRLIGLKALHGFSYVSCESVLFDKGIINQRPLEITMVSGLSKRFSVLGVRYRSRKMADNFLYNDAGIENAEGIRVATTERAVADMMYFNPNAYFDDGVSKMIDWKKVASISEEVGYKIKLPL